MDYRNLTFDIVLERLWPSGSPPFTKPKRDLPIFDEIQRLKKAGVLRSQDDFRVYGSGTHFGQMLSALPEFDPPCPFRESVVWIAIGVDYANAKELERETQRAIRVSKWEDTRRAWADAMGALDLVLEATPEACFPGDLLPVWNMSDADSHAARRIAQGAFDAALAAKVTGSQMLELLGLATAPQNPGPVTRADWAMDFATIFCVAWERLTGTSPLSEKRFVDFVQQAFASFADGEPNWDEVIERARSNFERHWCAPPGKNWQISQDGARIGALFPTIEQRLWKALRKSAAEQEPKTVPQGAVDITPERHARAIDKLLPSAAGFRRCLLELAKKDRARFEYYSEKVSEYLQSGDSEALARILHNLAVEVNSDLTEGLFKGDSANTDQTARTSLTLYQIPQKS